MDLCLVFLVILACLIFTYTNGLQDGSSVTATLIASRAISPAKTILLVAVCELLGAVLGGTSVAAAVQSIINMPVQPSLLPVLLAGVLSGGVWNLLAKRLSLPASSTHALFGGIIGAVLAAAGPHAIVLGHVDLFCSSGLLRLLLSLFLSPFAGLLAGWLCFYCLRMILQNASSAVHKPLRIMQCFTTALLAFGHGANDPQKVMGIILLAIQSVAWHTSDHPPLWVHVSTGLAICLGVLSLAPGIVKRVGTGIFRLHRLHALSSEIASTVVVLGSSLCGYPVSTSQVVASTLIGVGTAERPKSVRWLIARDIGVSWLLTLPFAAFIGMLLCLLLRNLLRFF